MSAPSPGAGISVCGSVSGMIGCDEAGVTTGADTDGTTDVGNTAAAISAALVCTGDIFLRGDLDKAHMWPCR